MTDAVAWLFERIRCPECGGTPADLSQHNRTLLPSEHAHHLALTGCANGHRFGVAWTVHDRKISIFPTSAWRGEEQKTKRPKIEWDDERQIVTIEGQKFSFEFFKQLGPNGLIVGEVVEVVERRDGEVVFRSLPYLRPELIALLEGLKVNNADACITHLEILLDKLGTWRDGHRK